MESSVSRSPSPSSSSSTPRREFLEQLLATAAVLAAGTACAGATAAQGGQAAAPASGATGTNGTRPAAPPAAPQRWDDAWAQKLTAKHKAVFDAPEIADGIILANAYVYMMSYKAVYGVGDAEVQPVLVIRHAAIPMAVDDEFWAKYELGKHYKVKDGSGKGWATRNPFYKDNVPGGPGAARGIAGLSLEGLQKRGAILLGCNLAASNMASSIARRTNQDAAAVRAEVKAHLVPGLELTHSGIFATMRAQEAGCTFLRST
jgi:hypothetical protein